MTTPLVINGRFLTQRVTGVQRHALEVTRRLVEQIPDRVRIITPNVHDDDVPEALRPFLCRAGRTAGHFWEQTTLARAARAQGGVLWSPSNAGPLACTRQVLTLHDVFAIEHPQWVSRRYHLLHRILLPRLSRRVQRILTVSAYSRDRIVEVLGVSPSNVTVVYNGVDASMQPVDESCLGEVRRRYAVPDRYLLALGSLEPRKNLRTIVEAWGRLPPANRPALVFVGAPGPQHVFGKPISLDRAGSQPGLMQLGYVDDRDLPALYCGCAAFIHAAFAEGFGLPPLEALCCGAPVIASHAGALPEILTSHARYFDPRRPDELTEAIEDVLTSPLPEAQRHSIARAVQPQWSWDLVARRVVDALLAALP